jgi:hypothetical protein
LEEAQLLFFGEKGLTDKEFKQNLLKGFFADNRFAGSLLAMFLFKFYFPRIYGFMAALKREGKRQFAHLLQHLESVIFLLKIAKRVSEDYPTIPFYTIHDNLVTTECNVGRVKKLMDEEFIKWIGIAPTFGEEAWGS